MQRYTKLKVLDLFSGIGAFDLGLSKTGLFETVAFCEWDLRCQQVLKKNFKDVQVFQDVSDLHYQNGELVDTKVSLATEIDVIVGGFPCQDVSVANPNGKGLEGVGQDFGLNTRG